MEKKSSIPPSVLDDIVTDLMASYDTLTYLTNLQGASLPSVDCVSDLIGKLKTIIYPGLIECVDHDTIGLRYYIGQRTTESLILLQRVIETCLRYAASCQDARFRLPESSLPLDQLANDIPESSLPLDQLANDIAIRFFRKLPTIRELLHSDMRAAYHGDPAAQAFAEIILSYPGIHALTIHRLAHELCLASVPILPRMMSEIAHRETGIDIHPGAQVGHSFFIDHGTGVVIGETSTIGNNVKLYQGVTLGALSIHVPKKGESTTEKRHPTLEDGVTVYANATILGGKTVVGANSIIGANVWLTQSVDPGTKVYHVPSDHLIKPI